ncbi:alpha/beta hydrolase [uncultured Anaerococcus sp.]|uniref:alpha/beta fold hydrolase n=1 Tax=uncultured Anaerococcus sp. TaxID=293428 RepID=UPI0028046C26|nr:alpha/beta hydrolase [uncultured Anaerococcus sp.]
MGKEIILKDKTKIYYKEYGRGEDLFLLHGNDGDMTYFEYQIGCLSRYFHLILIDFRDHGVSTNEKK